MRWDSRKTWHCRFFGCDPVRSFDDVVSCDRCKRIIHIGIEHFLPDEYDAHCSARLGAQKKEETE